jgi:hypothetical protein
MRHLGVLGLAAPCNPREVGARVQAACSRPSRSPAGRPTNRLPSLRVGLLMLSRLAILCTATALTACAASTRFTIPAKAFFEDQRRDFGPGPADRQEGDDWVLYMYPAAVTAARCEPPKGDLARCAWSYTYGLGEQWSNVVGCFRRPEGGSWRYIPHSAYADGPRRDPVSGQRPC